MQKNNIALSVAVLSALALLGAGCAKKSTPKTVLNIEPSISISAQSLDKDNQLTIDKASIGDNGWIVIHKKENGLPGKIIGYTSVFKGESTKIKIAIDKAEVSPSLIATLYYDRGESGIFDFPNGDSPVIKDQKVIMQEFNLLNFAEVTKEEPVASVGSRKEFVITAKQWSFSPSVIRVKRGDKVVLKLKSADVAHSIFIADFGINATMKPGEINEVEFIADKVGTFKFICKIPCGVGHLGMTGTIIVE